MNRQRDWFSDRREREFLNLIRMSQRNCVGSPTVPPVPPVRDPDFHIDAPGGRFRFAYEHYVDFAWSEEAVIVLLDGTGSEDWWHILELQALGWTVVHISVAMIHHDPLRVLRELAMILGCEAGKLGTLLEGEALEDQALLDGEEDAAPTPLELLPGELLSALVDLIKAAQRDADAGVDRAAQQLLDGEEDTLCFARRVLDERISSADAGLTVRELLDASKVWEARRWPARIPVSPAEECEESEECEECEEMDCKELTPLRYAVQELRERCAALEQLHDTRLDALYERLDAEEAAAGGR